MAKLGAEITELESQLSENEESLANQTEARKLEKTENDQTVADAKSAEEAVAKAIEVRQKQLQLDSGCLELDISRVYDMLVHVSTG